MNRRSFLGLPLAVVAAGALGSVIRHPAVLWGDGIHDDTKALNEWGRGAKVIRPDGSTVGPVLACMRFRITGVMTISRTDRIWILNNMFICPEVADRMYA